MLSLEEKRILQTNISVILKSSQSISQQTFIETYNTVYAHCTSPSPTYSIKGELIYEVLSGSLEAFAASLEFQGSLEYLSQQIDSLRRSSDHLAKIFSYLERFYIRSSILKELPEVRSLKDLFYFQIYFKYIYNVEEALLDLIFLEIDTYRKLYRQECEELKNIITFYLDALTSTGQENTIKKFYQRYVEDFKINTNFKIEIGKLLKKVYFEMFFISNSLKEKDMCKEIIQMINFRKDEVIDYAFLKIGKLEKFKHVYKIISMMPEQVRNKFKSKYEDNIKSMLQNVKTFAELYKIYNNFKNQIVINKLSGYEELLNDIVKRSFAELSKNDQLAIQKEMVDAFDNYIDMLKGTLNITESNRNIANKNDLYSPRHFVKRSNGANNADLEKGALSASDCSANNESSSNLGNSSGSDRNQTISISPDVYFDLFSNIVSESLIDLYAENCQYRLLKGSDPVIEHMFSEIIVEKIGWGAASRIKSSVASFTNRYYLEITNPESQASLSVSLAKITKAFWEIQRGEINLHRSLKNAKDSILTLVKLDERQILDFNYKVSPVIFEVNKAKYKMAADVVSLYLHILDFHDKNGISYEHLKALASDPDIDSNIETLLENGFVYHDRTFRVLNKKTDQSFVDFFSIPKKISLNDEKNNVYEMGTHINEAKICKMLKKLKTMRKEDLFDQVDCSKDEFDRILLSLITKGFLDSKDDVIIYIP